MTQADILALAHAGFTSTQILAIGQLTQQQPVVQTPVLQQPAPQPVVQTPVLQQPVVQTPVLQQPAPQPVVQTDPVLEQLKILTGAVQSNALLTAQQTQQTQTADNVLASIINPPVKEDNK